MAALDRRNPNLDDFVGLNWSCWVDGVNILPSDECSDSEGSSRYERTRSDSMALMKEDMHIYGHCPAHDEIYLVVCSHCGKVVKPQAFERHCERWHALLLNTCSTASSLSSQQQPRPGRPSSSLFVCRKKKDGRDHKDSGSSPAALTVRHPRLAKDTASFSDIEKSPPKNPPPHPLQSSSTPHPTVPLLHSGPLTRGQYSSSTSLPERPAAQKPTAGQPSRSQSPQRGTRTCGPVYKNISEKECELSKHCGALDPKRKKLCSRELSCNSDFSVQQQKTSGRTKTFDQLAAEQRADSTEQNVEQFPVKAKENTQHLEGLEGKIKSQDSKNNFNSSCHIVRSRGPSKSFTEEADSSVEVEVQSPYPFNQTLLSSDDEEVDDQEEAENLPATTHHPKPLGFCTFGCRAFGCSIFTFDRRWHHLRFAFSTMLESHDSTHIWKKRPQVPKGLRSNYTPISVGPTDKTGARFPKSTHTLSLDSISPGHLETETSQNSAHINKPSSSSPTVRPSPGQTCRNPVRQTSRSQLKEVELPLDANSEDKSFTHNRDPIHNERGQSSAPLRPGPANGSFSYRQKPCSPQLKDMDCDQSGQAQRRRGRKESISHSSSVSRNSKYKRLSPSSGSKLLAWK